MEDMTIPSLKGKKVLITGSSRGIGYAMAEGFAKNGCSVAIHGTRMTEKLAKAKRSLEAFGAEAVIVCGDLSDPSAPQRIVTEAAEALGGLDVLVSNVSVQIRKPWSEITDEEMRLQTEVNFFAGIKLIQAAVPYMLNSGWGRIITVGSTQQEKPHPDMLIYSANKSAMRNVVQSLAGQLADKNITVNNLSVGTIHTDRNAEVLSDPEYYEKVRKDIPTGFIGQPNDCVGAALLLASDAGRYITAENLHIDGGKAFI